MAVSSPYSGKNPKWEGYGLNRNNPLFTRLHGFVSNQSEHDWLEQRFSNMTVKERLLFLGALELERPKETSSVIEIANGLTHYELYYGAGTDKALGNFVMEHLDRPNVVARHFLDVERVGAAYRDRDHGIFQQGHYIRRTALPSSLTHESSVPLSVTGDYAIRVKLASRSNMDGVWVGFPDTGEHMDIAYPDELRLGLDALQAETLQECIVLTVDCCLPQLTNIPSQYSSADTLIRHAIDFGYAWAEQGRGNPYWFYKWQAVMEVEHCHRLDQALDYTMDLHHYSYVPPGVEPAVFGRELAIHENIIPKSGLLSECFDGKAYLEGYIQYYELSTTEHGQVAWTGDMDPYGYCFAKQSTDPSLTM